MASKLGAGRRAWEIEPISVVSERDASFVMELDPELEAEVATIAAWFEALPADVRAYLDDQARSGREDYVWP